jgi:hypothetical protein
LGALARQIALRAARMADERSPTLEDIDELVCAATPHFAFQIRARVRALIRDLDADNAVRRHGEGQIAALERLGFSSSKAAEGPLESAGRIGWETIPSHRPARPE